MARQRAHPAGSIVIGTISDTARTAGWSALPSFEMSGVANAATAIIAPSVANGAA